MNSVENDVKTLVDDTVAAQFERLGLDPPVFAQFDVTSSQGKIQVSINVLSDQPVGVIRETRELVTRALSGRGYRVEPATEPVTAPAVHLTLMSSVPASNYLSGYEPARIRDYLAVGGMAMGSLLMLIIAALMFKQLRRVVRRRGKPVVVSSRTPVPAPLPPEPTFAAFAGELPPLPDVHGGGDTLAPVDQMLAAATAEVSAGTLDAASLASASRATVRSAFSQLSLDSALELLAAVDPETSRAIIEKLQLHKSVRERLEEGVAQLRLRQS